MPRCSPPSASRCCRPSPGMARSPPGSSTTPAFPRRARTRSASRASIAASWASRRTARSPCRCRSRTLGPACRSRSRFTCPRTGPAIRLGGPRPGCPAELGFRTKPADRPGADPSRAGGLRATRRHPGDAGYGIDTGFRLALSELALVYVLRVQSSLGLWPPGCGPLPPKPSSGKGRPPKLWRRDAAHQPVTAKDLALALPASAWQMVSWRQGRRRAARALCRRARAAVAPRLLAGRAACRGIAADRVAGRKKGRAVWLSTLPARPPWSTWSAPPSALADRAGLPGAQAGTRPRSLRGAGWLRFHHHATLCSRLMASSFASEPCSPSAGSDACACATHRLAATRASRCDRSGIIRSRSPRCAAVSRSPWLAACHSALVVSSPP